MMLPWLPELNPASKRPVVISFNQQIWTGGQLRHILVSSDYDILTPVSLIFSYPFFYIPNYTCLSSFSPKSLLYYRKTLPKLRSLPSLKQPFSSLLLQISKIYKMWKVSSVVSLFFMDLHLFFMLPLHLLLTLYSSNVLFSFFSSSTQARTGLSSVGRSLYSGCC